MADYNSSYTGTQIDQGVGIALDLNGHKTDTTVHITASERSTWNAKQAALTFDSTPTANSGNPVTSGGIKTALDAKADTGHTHSADDISGGTLDSARLPTVPVSKGGTGAETLTSGAALIGNGTGAVTTRSITNNTSSSTSISGSTNLVTMNTLRYAMNRTTGISSSDTNYSTAMVRAIYAGTSDLTAGSSSLTSGQIYLVYE